MPIENSVEHLASTFLMRSMYSVGTNKYTTNWLLNVRCESTNENVLLNDVSRCLVVVRC
jgi:hypothetical protein